MLIRLGLVSIVAAAGIAGSTGQPVDTTAVLSAPKRTSPGHQLLGEIWVYFVRPETHKPGEVTYRYGILNHGSSQLAEIQIGIGPSPIEREGLIDVPDDLEEPEISEAPIGWHPHTNNCPPSIEVPPGWTGCIGRQEESNRIYLIFAATGDSSYLDPDSSLSVAVTVARPDSTYSTARFFALSTSFPHYYGRVTPILTHHLPDQLKTLLQRTNDE